MTTEQKDKIRKIVKSVMSGLVENLVDDSSDSYICDRIFDSLPDEFPDEVFDEIDDLLVHGECGEVSKDTIESMVEELTDSFMEKFN